MGPARGRSLTPMPRGYERLLACHCCGLIQGVGPVPPGKRACCVRCGVIILDPARVRRSNDRAAAAALAALILYPFALSLPIMRIERFGHLKDSSIWAGAIELLSRGSWFVGTVVVLCSVVIPLLKLAGLLSITLGARHLGRKHRAATYRWIEWTGRWGMLDVLLIAVVVAWVKIGDMVEVSPGPAALTFTLVVLLSLLASAQFDPHAVWQDDPQLPTEEDLA